MELASLIIGAIALLLTVFALGFALGLALRKGS